MRREVRDTALKSTVQIASAIRRGAMSSSEVLERCVRRVDQFNPSLNAVVVMDLERARERARLADDASSRGEVWGPLHGLPMTIKDSFEVCGMPTTSGAPKLKNHQPTRNATAVQRLTDAGAIIFGKTNLPIYADDVQTYNEVYGTTNNPWTFHGRRVARPVVPRRHLRPASRRLNWAAISADRSAIPPISVGCMGTNRHGESSRRVATFRRRQERSPQRTSWWRARWRGIRKICRSHSN